MEAQAGVAWLSSTSATYLALSPQSMSKGRTAWQLLRAVEAPSPGAVRGLPCKLQCIHRLKQSFIHSIPWLHGQAEGRKRAKEPAAKTFLRGQGHASIWKAPALSHGACAEHKHRKLDFRHGREAVTLALQKCGSSASVLWEDCCETMPPQIFLSLSI